ncbi:MAG: hypothetical protein ACLVAI_04440 [Anaerovoracaceae bacterium]
MNHYDEIRARLKTAHMFFGEDAVNRGNALLDKYLLEGAITQEEYEKLLEENRTMECDEVWVPEDH